MCSYGYVASDHVIGTTCRRRNFVHNAGACVVCRTYYTSVKTHKMSFSARPLIQMYLLWVWKGGLKCTFLAWKIFFAFSLPPLLHEGVVRHPVRYMVAGRRVIYFCVEMFALPHSWFIFMDCFKFNSITSLIGGVGGCTIWMIDLETLPFFPTYFFSFESLWEEKLFVCLFRV